MSHPRLVLNNPLSSVTKDRLNEMHTIMIDLNQSTENQKKKEKNLNESL